jgi:hypothetical protein
MEVQVDLSYLVNNVGTTSPENLGAGRFNVWNNSFPASELPASGQRLDVDGVPFAFPAVGSGEPDNIRCEGQRIDVPHRRYDWIYLLTCAERRTEDVARLHYADGAVDAEPLRVSDFWPGSPPRFGEVEAVRCATMHFPRHRQERVGPVIWQQRVAVVRRTPLVAVRLPDNIAIHIFAMTLISERTRA